MTTEPKLLTEAEAIRAHYKDRDDFLAELRERGLIAEEPVDPLLVDPLLVEAREIVAHANHAIPHFAEAVLAGKRDAHLEVRLALASLRRGMDLAPRKELTREMVRQATRRAGWFPGENTIAQLHAALTEALQ